MTEFNSETIYEVELKPLISKIHRICAVSGMPMFITIAVAGNDRETVYESRMVSPSTRGIELKDDLFPDFLFLLNGSGKKVRQRWEI